MPKPFLLVNPRSAAGSTGRHFDTIAAAVRKQLGDHDHALTERPRHATELVREALRRGAERVVAVGGDGTINEVVNGFFEEPEPGGRPRPINAAAALAILPHGTGGDLRRTVSLEGDLHAVSQRLGLPPRPVDVGWCEYLDEAGRPAARCFLNVAGCGVGAEIVRISNQSSKALGGKLSFLLASLRGLAGWSDVAVRAILDDGAPEELLLTSYSVANGRYFGGGMLVAPEARIDDGLFHVTIWKGFGPLDFVRYSGKMYDGSHVRLAGTSTASAKRVRLEPVGERVARVELDGELVGRLPATYQVLPGALQLAW
jgi:YegS/Rv2252/BmrU family lipid kinase